MTTTHDHSLAASVVIPTRDRPERLAGCLASLAGLQTPRARFEVIVVDDGSRSPMGPVVERFGDRLDVTWLRHPTSRGPAAARNAGAARARADVLVFTDDDCTATPGWLDGLLRAAQGPGAGPGTLVGGRIENALPERPCSTASQLLIAYLYDRQGPVDAFFCTNNLAVRTDEFRALGGFDETFPHAAGEDRELCDRFVHEGGRLVYAPDAIVRHAHRLGPLEFSRQHFRYGRAARHFQRVRARRGAPPVPLRPLSFYAGMLRYPFGRERGPWLQAFLLGVSQLANAAGFVVEALRPQR